MHFPDPLRPIRHKRSPADNEGEVGGSGAVHVFRFDGDRFVQADKFKDNVGEDETQ